MNRAVDKSQPGAARRTGEPRSNKARTDKAQPGRPQQSDKSANSRTSRTGATLKAAQSKVFPVVLRIKEEIDFSSFYGDLRYDQRVCDRAFAKWVERGYRGSGELTIYIEMLAPHLEVPTQQSIFRNLANDCITVMKKTRRPEKPKGFLARYRFQILLNLLIFALLAGMFYLGRITS